MRTFKLSPNNNIIKSYISRSLPPPPHNGDRSLMVQKSPETLVRKDITVLKG
ncbi:hypothetical protein CKA32_003159 [Geitlerinema sp. FC II]|nr:hypothetical protein CKA32_003159 [Geitlerinema sp. FC II]